MSESTSPNRSEGRRTTAARSELLDSPVQLGTLRTERVTLVRDQRRPQLARRFLAPLDEFDIEREAVSPFGEGTRPVRRWGSHPAESGVEPQTQSRGRTGSGRGRF
jgi:hypothetical protein